MNSRECLQRPARGADIDGGCFGVLAERGHCGKSILSRGLIPNRVVAIPFGVLALIVFIALNDVSNLKGVLLMSASISAAIMVFYAVYLFTKLGRVTRSATVK